MGATGEHRPWRGPVLYVRGSSTKDNEMPQGWRASLALPRAACAAVPTLALFHAGAIHPLEEIQNQFQLLRIVRGERLGQRLAPGLVKRVEFSGFGRNRPHNRAAPVPGLGSRRMYPAFSIRSRTTVTPPVVRKAQRANSPGVAEPCN